LQFSKSVTLWGTKCLTKSMLGALIGRHYQRSFKRRKISFQGGGFNRFPEEKRFVKKGRKESLGEGAGDPFGGVERNLICRCLKKKRTISYWGKGGGSRKRVTRESSQEVYAYWKLLKLLFRGTILPTIENTVKIGVNRLRDERKKKIWALNT